jgi:hypothetical protein
MATVATARRSSRRSSVASAGVSVVSVTDLTGGLDRRVATTLMEPERARRLRNVKLTIPGEWQPRAGWASWLTSSVGTTRPQGAARIYLDGITPFTLLAADGDVYKVTDGGDPGTAVSTGWSDAHPVHFVTDSEIVAIFDGENDPQKSTDGETWTQMGITPPDAPTAAAASGGSLTDAHEIEVSASYADSVLATESNESDTTSATTASPNLSVTVTIARSTDPQVDTINVYARDVTAGESVRRFAGTVANPASGSATVTLTDDTWLSDIEAPTRKDVPPALDFGVPWKNRWWARMASDHTRLAFSEIFESQSWPALYYIDMPFTRGDEIAAIIPLGDVLVVFGKSKQAFLIIGQTSLDFEVRPSAAVEAGALGARAVDIVEQGIVHAAAQGVYIFDGASDRLLSNDIDTDWRAMIASATAADLALIPVCYHRRDKEIRIAVPTLPAYGEAGEYVLDLTRTQVKDVPAWATTDRPLGGYVQWDGAESVTGNQGRFFAWSNATGDMTEESTGTSADGDDLVVDYEGPELSAGLTVARFLALYLECEPNEGDFAVDVRVDGSTVLSVSPPIGGAVSAYGAAVYGTDAYGAANRLMIPIELPVEAEGRTIQIVGQYQGQGPFKWFGYGVALRQESQIRGM